VRPCVDVVWSVGHEGLPSHRSAHLDVVWPTARRRSAKHELALAAPPGRLAASQGGAPYLVVVVVQ
jgi:hypothetical protein